jgi:hypothetical protein
VVEAVAGSTPAGHPNPVYAVSMDNDADPQTPGLASKTGAVLLLLLGLGLLFIGADILTGGRLSCRGCADDITGAGN